MAAACLVAASLAFTLSPVQISRAPASFPRNRPLCAKGEFEPRDPEVQKATDVSNYLPSRFGLIAASLVGGVCVFFPDSPLGKALIAPPVQTKKGDKLDFDDEGEYANKDQVTPTAGLAVLGVYAVFRNVVRPRLEQAAREQREQQQQAGDKDEAE